MIQTADNQFSDLSCAQDYPHQSTVTPAEALCECLVKFYWVEVGISIILTKYF